MQQNPGYLLKIAERINRRTKQSKRYGTSPPKHRPAHHPQPAAARWRHGTLGLAHCRRAGAGISPACHRAGGLCPFRAIRFAGVKCIGMDWYIKYPRSTHSLPRFVAIMTIKPVVKKSPHSLGDSTETLLNQCCHSSGCAKRHSGTNDSHHKESVF